MPILNYHEVHLWSTDLKINPQEENIKFSQLSQDEQNRALQFKMPLHKTRFIAAHAALRMIAVQYFECSPKKIQFNYNEYKKPFFKDAPDIQFNLSHSDDIAIIGFTRRNNIGVDIELIKPSFNPNLVKRYFHPTEITQFEALSNIEKQTAFYQLWTRKEAILKATGMGLNMPLNSFALSLDPIEEEVIIQKKPWFLRPLTVKTPYLASLATANPVEFIQYYDFP